MYTAVNCVKMSALMADKDSCVLVWGIYVTYFMNSTDIDCLYAHSHSLSFRPTANNHSNEGVHVCVYLSASSCVKCRGSECVYTRFPLIQKRDSLRNSGSKYSDI